MTTSVIFVRHGETVWNAEKREMGQLDSPLTEIGIKQAKALAQRLADIEFSHLYSSDLGRATRTASYIADATGIELYTDIDLRERNMGIFQGLTREQWQLQYPQEWEKFNSADNFDYVIPQGESQRERQQRAIKAMDKLASRHPDNTIVGVSHSGILRGFLEYVLELQPSNNKRFSRNHATYNCFIKEDGRWLLDVWGDTGHLVGIA